MNIIIMKKRQIQLINSLKIGKTMAINFTDNDSALNAVSNCDICEACVSFKEVLMTDEDVVF